MIKHFFVLITVGCLISLGAYTIYQAMSAPVVLGDAHSERVWVYLSGLTDSFDSPQEVGNRALLARIGSELGLKFIAIKPRYRCERFENKLCWPHHTQWEMQQTYQYIRDVLCSESIEGFVGFSNGGFFLNRLAQFEKLAMPVISIAAGGFLEQGSFDNDIYLIIGAHDVHTYDNARRFYEQSKDARLNVHLIEHDGGHEMPYHALSELLYRIAVR